MANILIIEDEKLLADSIGTLLEKKGFEVEIVYDGETGKNYAESGIYDLLILDVMIPKMNGYEVARKVRSGNSDFNADGKIRSGRPHYRLKFRG